MVIWGAAFGPRTRIWIWASPVRPSASVTEAVIVCRPMASPPALMAAPEAGGNSLIIRIEPRPGRPTADRQLFDLYVIHIQGFQRAAFLTDSGSWSFAPVSVRRGLSMDNFPAVTARWTEKRLGTVPVLVIGARPSSDPLVQSNWLFRPILRSIAVRRRLSDWTDAWSAALVLVGLGAASVMAIGLVLYLARRPPDSTEP